MTIEEFLTARLDELSQRLDYWEQRYAHICLNTGPETDQWWDADIELPIAAIRADVAAKRRILELMPDISAAASVARGEGFNEWGWVDEEILTAMVQPYATHPDFDPSWTPDTPSSATVAKP